MDNPCRNCEKNIVLSDIKSVEKVLSYCFPEEFILHYLSFNGGVPSRAWWESNDGFEPLEIAFLKPFKYNKLTNDAPKSLIDGCYHDKNISIYPAIDMTFGEYKKLINQIQWN